MMDDRAEEIHDRATLPQERPPGPPTPEEIAPHFPQLEVMELLGVGGMGAVYKARQKSLDRLVALKILPPRSDRDATFADRFNREARALARLHHPNIVTVFDSGIAGEYYYFIMEFVDGVNLRQMMASGDFLPEQALAIVPPICEALQFAHDEGIAHRDIKPENILIDRRNNVKIADFGLAKLMPGGAGSRINAPTALTMPQQTLGTMHYMAPEQIERPDQVDHRADIYALGVVLYEMLTGELPIGCFPPPSEQSPVDARLDEIVLRTLQKQPERRYQQISDLKSDIELLSSAGAAPAGSAAGGRSPASFAPAGPSAHPAAAAVSPGQAFAEAPVFAPPGAHPPPAVSYGSDAGGGGTAFGPVPKSTGLAYLLWLPCFFGACGLHRMYAGKYVSGVIWFFTYGLLFIGQFVDLFLIPEMIRRANHRQYAAHQWGMHGPVPPGHTPPPVYSPDAPHR